jgi:uncharacterized membrane protein YkoI
MKTFALVMLCAASALTAAPAFASGGGRDAERARAALSTGAILSLPALLQRMQTQNPGHVLEAELDLENQRWVYDLKLLPPTGGVVRLELDARDGSVLQRREKRRSVTPAATPAAPAAPATPAHAS